MIGATIVVHVLHDDIPDAFPGEALRPQSLPQAPHEFGIVCNHAAQRSAAESRPKVAQEEGARRVAVLLLRPLLRRCTRRYVGSTLMISKVHFIATFDMIVYIHKHLFST